MVTAWTKEADDEHRLLAGVLACMYRQGRIDPQLLQGALAGIEVPVLVRAMPPDYLVKPADYWGVMDNDLHASLTWVATTPLDAFRPFTGPMVRTRELLVGELDQPGRDMFVEVAGVAHRKGDPLAGIPDARVTVAGTGLEALTDREGRFTFPRIGHGDFTWRVETPDGKAVERKVTVPSGSYDVEID
jgi:hypothetical protein